MGLIPMEASFSEEGEDVVGNILQWLDQKYAHKEIVKGGIPSVNGAAIDAWELVARLRDESEKKGLRFVVVKNVNISTLVFSVGNIEVVDVVKKLNSGKVVYWFEKCRPDGIVVDRMSMNGFIMKALVPEEGQDGVIRTCLVECQKDFAKIKERLLDGERVAISGMEVSVSTAGKVGQDKFILVQDFTVLEEDASKAEDALKAIKDWRQLSPMMTTSRRPMFSDSVVACLLANAIFSKPSVPAFNLLVIGPKRNQKSTLIKFITRQMMGGSVPVSGTASAGKGWLVSHKEDARPSKLFSERNALMIDEALKFVSADERKGLVVKLKEHFQRHMEILQRTDVSAESGNSKVEGRMRCSLVSVDNPDATVMDALGKAYKMADAAFRRWSYMYMERLPLEVEPEYMSEEESHERMAQEISDSVGSMQSVRMLMLFTRKKMNEYRGPSFSPAWLMRIFKDMLKDIEDRIPSDAYGVIYGIEESWVVEKVLKDLEEQVKIDMVDSVQAAWLCSAGMRGWEVHDSLDAYSLVFDEKQAMLAEMMVKELIRGRIRIIMPGVAEYHRTHEGVRRTENSGWRR